MIFGAGAARALVEGHHGVIIPVNPPRIDCVSLRVATAKLKLVTADDYGVVTARPLDVSFGDRGALTRNVLSRPSGKAGRMEHLPFDVQPQLL